MARRKHGLVDGTADAPNSKRTKQHDSKSEDEAVSSVNLSVVEPLGQVESSECHYRAKRD